MFDGGGTDGVAAGFEGPAVVIGGDSLEGEVGGAFGFENRGEASFGGVAVDGVVLSGLGKKKRGLQV